MNLDLKDFSEAVEELTKLASEGDGDAPELILKL